MCPPPRPAAAKTCPTLLPGFLASPGHMRLVLRLLVDQTLVASAVDTMGAQDWGDLLDQDIMGVAAMEDSVVDISEVPAMEALMVEIQEVAVMEATMVDIQELAAMEALIVDILVEAMEASMEAILEEVVMEVTVGVITMGASMEAILRETAMLDIMGVLQTAEDQIVDQHSMENLAIQAHLVGSTVVIPVVIQMA
jgi:hypothetical protein